MIRFKRLMACLFAVILVYSAGCGKKVERIEWIDGQGAGYDVSAPVKIIRDSYGVPHILADNDRDLFYALGYAMAQDRFLYMDIMRRVAEGELHGLLGHLPSYKNYDLDNMMKAVRALDYKGQALQGVENMSQADLKLLVAFTDGVNRYLADAGDSIPQYKFLNTRPEEWKPEDSLACSMVFGLSMMWSSLCFEYYYNRLAREIGPEKALYFLHDYPEDAPFAVQDYEPVAADSPVMDSLFSVLGSLDGIGSNNWVVSGRKSKSGKPILCNDPHVPTILLTFWYHVHLQGGSFNVMGLMFPGLPVFGAGTNGRISWGITNARVDHVDIVREKINPDNPEEYLYNGEWREFCVIHDEIPVKGGEPIKFDIRRTVHGPVFDERVTGWPVPTDAPDEVYAFRILDVQLDRFFHGYLNVARAKDWKSFTAALKDKAKGPVAWNHVYADTKGNIGYYLSGLVPLRPDNQGIHPREGWTPGNEWTGYVPFEELPHIFNPRKGFIATANNRNIPDGYKYYVSASYDIPSRAKRITEVLESKEVFGVEDMKKLHYDEVVMSARDYVPVIIGDLEDVRDKKIETVVGELKKWSEQGYVADVDSVGTSIYKMFLPNFSRAVFEDDVGPLMMNRFGLTGMDKFAFPKIFNDPDSDWYDDVTTPQRERRPDIIQAAMKETVKDLEKKAGKKPDSWKWGDLQKVYVYSPAGFVPLFGKKHRLGEYPFGGTEETVNSSTSLYLPLYKYVYVGGPSTRLIIDMSDPERAYFNSSTGNSENMRGGRMGNMVPYWINGRYAVMSMNPGDYEKGKMGELILEP